MNRAWCLAVMVSTPLVCQAELWGYVDGNGVAHVAPTQVDSRYHLVLGNTAGQRVPGKTDGAGGLLTWLDFAPEVKSLQAILRDAAKTHGVDIELLKAIIAVESGFKPGAVSPKGAVGLMQIMPTGATPEARAEEAQRLLDPRHNIHTGARLLSKLMHRFGRIDVALAAWNAGVGTVMKHGGGMPPIAETQAHVHLVLELYWALLQNKLPHSARELQMHGPLPPASAPN
ncbi:lytic transglycosylase domain-containing protein [Rhizobacter sp. J219]|uniref:lytic transglycosylase domain-containing protein n=1 Tax=Rhizobacter sp. J219 TaxID=2898430 RepID=UPI002150D79B|nr:lytic transglycosylase domain-containing protein [Rhizobacter sp. J219]MCR5881526.1 lytic transglycosylase domain-containing protein [Rhizobacter sp. J219]